MPDTAKRYCCQYAKFNLSVGNQRLLSLKNSLNIHRKMLSWEMEWNWVKNVFLDIFIFCRFDSLLFVRSVWFIEMKCQKRKENLIQSDVSFTIQNCTMDLLRYRSCALLSCFCSFVFKSFYFYDAIESCSSITTFNKGSNNTYLSLFSQIKIVFSSHTRVTDDSCNEFYTRQ